MAVRVARIQPAPAGTEPRVITRRRALSALGLLGLASCSGSGESGSSSSASGSGTGTDVGTETGSTPTTPTSCVLIPEETAGPYPLFADIATAAQFQGQDITEGRTGVPLRFTLRIVNVNDGCAAITNAMVYVWHCDKDGVYSGYNQPGANATGETFCRGVQSTDSNGEVTFLTIYPGWYTGRITHIHIRVYLGNSLGATLQLAFPQDITAAVYASELYAARGQNASVRGFGADNVFSDGAQYQMCTVTTNASTGGYDAALVVGIAA
jgi:protocatechuate 3,4-dioxygenase beta subunit